MNHRGWLVVANALAGSTLLICVLTWVLYAHRPEGFPGFTVRTRSPSAAHILHPPVVTVRFRHTRNGSPETAPIVWIMDDIGLDRAAAARILTWPSFVAVAILPYGPFATEIAARACHQDRDVLIHLPMASVHPDRVPGPKYIRADSNPEQIATIVREAVQHIPCARGLNQHMGSGVSRNVRILRTVVESALQVGITFFIDSRTIGHSQLCAVAFEYGSPCLNRTIFFDVHPDPETLRRRLAWITRMARTRTEPIVVIAHPYPATLHVLDEYFTGTAWQSLNWQRVSDLLNADGL